jgi:hypothetical protein
VAINGCFLGWVLCAVAAAVPIFFLEDQLTQSTFLLGAAVSALLCWAGPREGRAARMDHGLALGVRVALLVIYALAALHKLNRDYFDPSVSCANEGLRVMAEQSADTFPAALRATFEARWWPIAQVAVEATIPLLLWRRPGYGVLLAAAMHLPLTIIYAPCFAFTIMPGWVCFFSGEQLAALGRVLRRRWIAVLGAGAIPGAASRAFLFDGRWATDPDWCMKEMFLWLVFGWLVVAAFDRERPLAGRAAWIEDVLCRGRTFALVAVYLVNGVTPYFGLQMHHTAAMLSNLRIDEGCYNSLVFPEAMRLDDPYVRIEAIGFARDRVDPEYRKTITDRLWEPAALYQARDYWCGKHDEPLPVAGSYRGVPFDVPDFCAADGWPLAEPTLLGFRRFQVNLRRTCPLRCVH